MKVFNNDSIFSSNDPETTPAEPAPAPKVERSTDEMVSSGREILAKVKDTPEDQRGDQWIWQQYRHLQATNPAEATRFWNQNRNAIYKLRDNSKS